MRQVERTIESKGRTEPWKCGCVPRPIEAICLAIERLPRTRVHNAWVEVVDLDSVLADRHVL